MRRRVKSIYLLIIQKMKSVPPIHPLLQKTIPMPNPNKTAPTTQAMNSCPDPNNCGSVPSGFFNNA